MKAKYQALYSEYKRRDDDGCQIEVRLELWVGPYGVTRYVLEWGNRKPGDLLCDWLKSNVAVLDGDNEALHIRTAIAKFDELVGGSDD